MKHPSPRVLLLVAANVVVFAVGAAFGARWVRPAHANGRLPTGASALELPVTHAQGSITLDGDTDDPGWQGAVARTGGFVDADGALARPHTEAKVAWGDGYLYVELYAADQDIHASHEVADGPVWESDSFHLVFSDGTTEHSFDVSPLGTLTDGERKVAVAAPGSPRPFDYRWNSGAHVSHELDGTPDRSGDEDEEWVIEMAIPFDALGLAGQKGERIGLSMHRCDQLKSGQRSCGSWGEGDRRGVLVLE
jgi:Carbohydrate family 9 binding domain-like